MKVPFIATRFAKYIVILILIVSFIFFLYWLWQRQPQPKELQTPETISENKSAQKKEEKLVTTPPAGSVQTSSKIKIEGKTKPELFVAIFSNDLAIITRSDKSGAFHQEVTLEQGLNQIEIVTISKDLKEDQHDSLLLYLAAESDMGTAVFAGPVKSIFDTLLTISGESGEISVRTTQTTKIKLPPPPGDEEATGPAIKNIRVGDFLIALGDPSDDRSDQLKAKLVEVVRENKPQNLRKLTLVKILSVARQSLFSAKSLADNSILELTIDKASQVTVDGKEAKSADIEKNKNAIIIYHPDANKKLLDLIYLLP